MNLAAILGFCLWGLGFLPSQLSGFLPRAFIVVAIHSNSNAGQNQAIPGSSTSSSSTSASQAQAAHAQSPSSAQAPGGQNSAKPSVPPKKKRTRAKKAIYPDCSTAPTTLNPVLNSGKLAKPDSAAKSNSSGSNSTSAGSAGTAKASGNSQANSTPAGGAPSRTSKPCPPPKKVVRDGGADEPKIELLGGSPTDQASSARSTEEITAATEENLKTISERPLNASEQETVSQIREFMEQSKKALAAGDPERAQSLATKARLLSEELLKP
jgi:hypothetical protein